MGVALLVARLALAVVFAVAGIAKLADRQGSRQAMAGFGVPAALTGVAAFVVPIAELTAAGLLVPASTATSGALLALALLLGFSAGIARNLALGIETDCHCFGQLHSAPAGWSTLARNGALTGLAGFVVIAGWNDAGESIGGAVGGLSAAEALAGVNFLLLLAAATFFFQLLKQHGRVLVRLDQLEHAVTGGPAAAAAQPRPHIGLALGAEAPGFALPGLHGEVQTLEALLAPEKPLILVFSDPGCGPCNALLPEIGEWQRQHEAELTVAVISRGDVEKNRAKTKEHGVTNLLIQEEREVYEAYEGNGTPCAVLVSADGRIASPVVPGAEAIRELVRSVTAPRLEPVRAGGNGAPPERPEPDRSQVGQPAPEIRLPDLEGNEVTLEDFAGKETLVLFWNPGCGFCQQMLDDLKAWEAERPEGAPDLLVVSTGEVERNREQGFASTVLLDSGFGVGSSYNAGGTPMGVLVDAEGRIASHVAAGADAVLELAGGGPVRA